jgi:hypothetical protein
MNPEYTLGRRLGGSQSRSGRDAEKKNSQLLLGLEQPIIHTVAQHYTTELSWLFLQATFAIKIYA